MVLWSWDGVRFCSHGDCTEALELFCIERLGEEGDDVGKVVKLNAELE